MKKKVSKFARSLKDLDQNYKLGLYDEESLRQYVQQQLKKETEIFLNP